MVCSGCLNPVVDPALTFSADRGACAECLAKAQVEYAGLRRIFDAMRAGGIDKATANRVMVAYIDSRNAPVQ